VRKYGDENHVFIRFSAFFVLTNDLGVLYVGLAEERYNPYLTRGYNGFSPNMCKAVRLM